VLIAALGPRIAGYDHDDVNHGKVVHLAGCSHSFGVSATRTSVLTDIQITPSPHAVKRDCDGLRPLRTYAQVALSGLGRYAYQFQDPDYPGISLSVYDGNICLTVGFLSSTRAPDELSPISLAYAKALLAQYRTG
jgi:hypothetical protein